MIDLGRVTKATASTKRKLKDEYFLVSDLTPKQIASVNALLAKEEDSFKLRAENNAIMKLAEIRGRQIEKLVLRTAQVKPAILVNITKKLFLGDKPGLGKTVISCEAYALYCLLERKNGRTPKKVLVTTESSHVKGFAKDWERMGINLLVLEKGTSNIEKILKKNDIADYDGVIINWDGLKTNGFLEMFLENADAFGFGIFDETKKLLNNKAVIYGVVNKIVNTYNGGLEYTMLLNGTSFEKNIYDFYYQFAVLKPKLIPSKAFLDNRYVVRSGRNVFVNTVVTRNNLSAMQTVQRRVGEIVDYQNQAELKDRLKYFYIARSKSDYSKDLPEYNYKLHTVDLNALQKKILERSLNMSLINSPKTSNPKAKFDMKSSPKLEALIEFADMVYEDRPIVYAYNKESQRVICEELTNRGYRVEILNGDVKDKQEVIDRFNNKELDMLVFNIDSAINLPTSDRILFYDIPTMPRTTNQVKARIDRNNYTDPKFYDFFCYLDSPEMYNIVQLAYFREHHSNEFTGQVENVYSELLHQLYSVYSKEALDMVGQMFDADEELQDKDIKEIYNELKEILK